MKTSGSVGGAKESLGDVVEQVGHSLIDACAVGLAVHSPFSVNVGNGKVWTMWFQPRWTRLTWL